MDQTKSEDLGVIDSKRISGCALFSVKFAEDTLRVYEAGKAGNVIVCCIEEEMEGTPEIITECVLRGSNIYAGMKIREEKEKGMSKIRAESLKCQGAETEDQSFEEL